MKKLVYHVDINTVDGIVRLYFPSAQTRKLFCLTNRAIVAHCGRRPLLATKDDLSRARLNIERYTDFILIWDAFVK